MHDYSPLSPLELRAIEDSLNAGKLDLAQQQLARLAAHADLVPGSAYLATRLLFLRGQLDAASVVERMRELVGAHPTFVEARSFMTDCQTILHHSGAAPAAGSTPRPRSLFPSAPPESSSPAAVPPPKPTRTRAASEQPPAWSVEELEQTELLDSDRPTVEPVPTELHQDQRSLAPTQYPGDAATAALRSPVSFEDRSSREIRVDTRHSFIPGSSSLPPPNLYNPSVPRPVGRYSHSGRPERLSGAPHHEEPRSEEVKPTDLSAERSGRYRMSHVSSEVIPIPLIAAKALPGTKATALAARVSPSRATMPATQSGPGASDEDRPTPFRVPRPAFDEANPAHEGALAHPWLDPERTFIHDEKPARARLEQRALELLEPYPETFADFEQRAAELSALLSTAPVVHCFAPFDRSLCSLARLELSLRTLYGSVETLPARSIRPLLALYLGDVIRTSHRGTWRGTPDQPSTWAVEAGAHLWQPLRCGGDLFKGPPGQSLLNSLGNGLARRGTVAWMNGIPTQTPLPKPWLDPLTPQKQTELGQWVRSSPWAACCKTLFSHDLDGSVQSLKALDQLLDVLFDASAAPRSFDPWLTRAATLAGAYVGVVLGVQRTAAWVERESTTGERYLAIELPGGLLATPVANIITRATSRKRSQLTDYVRALLRRAH